MLDLETCSSPAHPDPIQGRRGEEACPWTAYGHSVQGMLSGQEKLQPSTTQRQGQVQPALALFQLVCRKGERVAGKGSAASFSSAGWLGTRDVVFPNLNPNDVSAPRAEINSACHHLCPHDSSPRHQGDVLFDINPLEAFLAIHLVFPNQL